MNITSAYSLLPLISSIFVFTLGFSIWLKKRQESLHIVFFLFCITISIWLFGTFRLFNVFEEAEQIKWDRFIYIGTIFIPILLYHFGLVYTKNKKQDAILFIGYFFSILFLLISQSDYFVKGLYIYEWGVHTIAQIGHHFFLIYFAFYFILFFINLIQYYKKVDGKRKKEVKFMLIGFAILDIIGPLAFLPAYKIPVYPVIFLVGIPFALLLGYSVVKYNALNIKPIAAEIIIIALNILTFSQILFINVDLFKPFTIQLIFRSSIFLGFLFFSLILLKLIHNQILRSKEIEQLAASLKRANTRLEKANLQLKELDRQKDEFLSIATHQLRTPLSIIKGYISLIQENLYGKIPTKVKKVLKNMNTANNLLVSIVDEFLNVARLTQGKTKFTFKDSDLNDIINLVIKELQAKIKEKNIKIVWHPKKSVGKIKIDPEKITHVIFNMTDNAIKYSEKGKINITLNKKSNGLIFQVTDEGIGFEKEDEVNFFQKFYRGKNIEKSHVSGTGLGLYIAKKFIQAHQGDIWAKSKGLNKGSEFGFWIPYKRKNKK